jgi:hypothetical protein
MVVKIATYIDLCRKKSNVMHIGYEKIAIFSRQFVIMGEYCGLNNDLQYRPQYQKIASYIEYQPGSICLVLGIFYDAILLRGAVDIASAPGTEDPGSNPASV